MTMPSRIQFQYDSEQILRSSLISAFPEEGCALLIGDLIELETQNKPNIFNVHLIWPS